MHAERSVVMFKILRNRFKAGGRTYRLYASAGTAIAVIMFSVVLAMQNLLPMGGLATVCVLSVIVFADRMVRLANKTEKAYDDMKEAQDIARLGTFVYTVATDTWTSSEILDSIFKIDSLYPRFGEDWFNLFQRAQAFRKSFLGSLSEVDVKTFECERATAWQINGQDRWVNVKAQVYRDATGTPKQIRGTAQDITDRKVAANEIARLAMYDALTGLPNRRAATQKLEDAISASATTGRFGAVLYLDLDRFKVINDSYGHFHGDLILKETAQRLRYCVRYADSVSRLGGDEFVVIVEDMASTFKDATLKAGHLAEKIRAALIQPYDINGLTHHSSSSIGVAILDGRNVNTELLLKQADMAMYQAKETGRNAVAFFDQKLQDAVATRLIMERELREDLRAGKLMVYYQVQVDESHHPTGAEALLRWRHDTMGFVSPSTFIPIAEESGLIVEMGNWVLMTACKQLHAWSLVDQTSHLTLAVNVSSRQFDQQDFITTVKRLLKESPFPLGRLKLELTESVVINDVAAVARTMNELKQMGILLSMDDFGTGYSSLASLKNLPLNQVKIDQSFVRDISTDSSDAMMVKTIIDLAANFNLRVIAEGVENEVQLAFLKAKGCKFFQGYYFSRPVPIAEFEALIHHQGELIVTLP